LPYQTVPARATGNNVAQANMREGHMMAQPWPRRLRPRLSIPVELACSQIRKHRATKNLATRALHGIGESICQVFEVGQNSAFARLGFEHNVTMHNEVADEINHVVIPEIMLSTRATSSPQRMERVILPKGTVNAPHDFAPRDRNAFWFRQRSTPVRLVL
jgi:hypothetical protein